MLFRSPRIPYLLWSGWCRQNAGYIRHHSAVSYTHLDVYKRQDWGYAKDYVECMWMILQHDTPEDFGIATGEYHTVREFCTLAFKEVGIEWRDVYKRQQYS